jgi:hypothetical protein
MLTEVNGAAGFLPKREFHASLATSVSVPGKCQHKRTLVSRPEQYAITGEREVRRKV